MIEIDLDNTEAIQQGTELVAEKIYWLIDCMEEGVSRSQLHADRVEYRKALTKCTRAYKLVNEAANLLKSIKTDGNKNESHNSCPYCGKDLLTTSSEQAYCVCGYEKCT